MFSRALSVVRNSVVRSFARTNPVSSRSFNTAAATTPPTAPASVKRVAVIGAGQMGTGIAYVSAAVAKLPTLVVDINPIQIANSQKFTKSLLDKEVSKNRLTAADRDGILSRLTFSSSMDDLRSGDNEGVDFAIEAATEKLEIKKSLFQTLAQKTKPSAILATNTSSISITKIAAAADKRANQVIGMHFMNPVPVMKLVEIIDGLQTDKEVLQTTLQLAASMGKITSHSDDVPGFIANRLLMPYINEAVVALSEGLGSREDIDATMKYGTNMPMGPLTLADFIGLDTCLFIMQTIHSGLGDSKYRPSPLLQKYVDAGWLGKKSGRGFYEYEQTNTIDAKKKD